MIERFVQRIERFEWPEEAGPEVGAMLREGLPRSAARRMTRLGLLCTKVLREMPASPETAIVYATSMSEARTLEHYLESFPDPSPTGFQASIHPAGAQQALIALGRPTREFYPLAGGGNLFDQALRTCLLAEASDVVLVAGEEYGGWLREAGLASDRSFAFALHLSGNANGAEAILRLNEAANGNQLCMKLADTFDQLASRQDWEISSKPSGRWEWQWL